jgi:hypothetical protein
LSFYPSMHVDDKTRAAVIEFVKSLSIEVQFFPNNCQLARNATIALQVPAAVTTGRGQSQ